MILGKRTLTQQIADFEEFCNLPDIAKVDIDAIQMEFMEIKEKGDVITHLVKNLYQLFFHQLYYLKQEEYEICAKIKHAAELQIEDSRRICQTYFLSTDFDEEMFDLAYSIIFNRVELEYDMLYKYYTNNNDSKNSTRSI
jgi:hypothetical protein